MKVAHVNIVYQQVSINNMMSDEIKRSKSRFRDMIESQRLEDALKNSLHRIEVLERKLSRKLLTTESREILEHELELMKEVLRENEERLQSLRRENTKSFIVVVAMMFGIFFIYGLFCMISNTG